VAAPGRGSCACGIACRSRISRKLSRSA
jgi:hypothetical protein